MAQHHLLGEVEGDLIKVLENDTWEMNRNARRLPQQQGGWHRNSPTGSPAAGTTTTGPQMGCGTQAYHHWRESFLLPTEPSSHGSLRPRKVRLGFWVSVIGQGSHLPFRLTLVNSINRKEADYWAASKSTNTIT